jgi:hypothetical protein
MKKIFLNLLLSVPVMLGGCASEPAPTLCRANRSLLVVDTHDSRTGQVVAPIESAKMEIVPLLDKIKSLAKAPAVIVILENYQEAKPGPVFRDRSLPWYLGLRLLGYDHVVFVQGNGLPDPDGLRVVAEYN